MQLEIISVGMVIWLIWYGLVSCIKGEPTTKQSIRTMALILTVSAVIGTAV